MGEGVPRGEPAWRGEGGGLPESIYVFGGILLGAARGSHSASTHAQTHVHAHSHTLHSNMCAHRVTYMHRVQTQKRAQSTQVCEHTRARTCLCPHCHTGASTAALSHSRGYTNIHTHVHTAYSTVTHVHRGAWMCACTHTSHTHTRAHTGCPSMSGWWGRGKKAPGCPGNTSWNPTRPG